MIYNQSEFDLSGEWGIQGIKQLAPISDAVVIVDVLSFSTSVEIATSNGAIIYPYEWKDESAQAYADSLQAKLALQREFNNYSLSPTSLQNIPTGTKLVLPSPNGSSLTLQTGNKPTLAGCLRNCEAVAKFAQKLGKKIAVIPAGEKWEDGSLRKAFEDLIGAGAILSYLKGSLSPEAQIAIAAFHRNKNNLLGNLKKCSSGKELIARGFESDVDLAAAFNVSSCIPIFKDNFYKRTT